MISSQVCTCLIAPILPLMINLFQPIPASAQTPSSNGNTDIFILKTQDATHKLSDVSVISNFDWFNDGDKIGLTDGLTESDLDYVQLIDFDKDGRLDDAVIKIKSTEAILGVVLNADDFVLEGEFVSLPSLATQPIACLPKANINTCQLPAFNAFNSTMLPSSSGATFSGNSQQNTKISPKH